MQLIMMFHELNVSLNIIFNIFFNRLLYLALKKELSLRYKRKRAKPLVRARLIKTIKQQVLLINNITQITEVCREIKIITKF